ncbi:MAG: ABC transporter ATP-binding protein [bacterium]|nr:ABC transporter ATP-binding protein [bacterium]
MSSVRLENVTKVFRSDVGPFRGKRFIKLESGSLLSTDAPVTALDEVSIEVPQGEVLSVLGPSGCGKSTLLRVIAGLIEPDSGHVYFDNKCVDGMSPRNRRVGFVFQNYALYPHMTSKGNIIFNLLLRRFPDREIEERVRYTSNVLGVGFDALLSRRPGTLSSGQKQRVALGRCIIRNPSVFLLDEPLSDLDAKLRETTRIELKRLLRHFGITTVYVTHDQKEAISLGHRLAIMRQGKIIQQGTFEQIYNNPYNVFVASFLGSPPLSLIKGEVVDNIFYGGGIRFPTKGLLGEVIGGVKAEDIIEGGDFRGIVEVSEPNPSEKSQVVTVRIKGDVRIKLRRNLDYILEAGDIVSFSVKRMYFFDPITELLIKVMENKEVLTNEYSA